MQAVQFNTKLMDGPGYGYVIIPGDLLGYPTASVWVKMTINGIVETQRTNPLEDGSHRVEFNREMMGNLGLKPSQDLTMLVERADLAPMLNDMPPDFLIALQQPALEEDFKRLPPETQRAYFTQVESASPETRIETIRRIVAEIRAQKGDLPRGDSL